MSGGPTTPVLPGQPADRLPLGDLTAVKLFAHGEITARLLCGNPVAIFPSRRGQIAVLPAGAVAAYSVRGGPLAAFFIFRTGGQGAASRIPGVGRAVLLFLFTEKRSAVVRTRNFLRKLSRYGHDPSAFSDEFWSRAAGALVARARPSRHLLASLLAREGIPGGCVRGRARHDNRGSHGLAPHPELHPQSPAGGVLASARASTHQG